MDEDTMICILGMSLDEIVTVYITSIMSLLATIFVLYSKSNKISYILIVYSNGSV